MKDVEESPILTVLSFIGFVENKVDNIFMILFE